MTELVVSIKGIGLAAPGLPNWPDSQAVLRGEAAYQSQDMPRYAPTLLPPNEARRATAVGRLAFQSAEEAIRAINGEASQLASVFASSGGDTDIVNRICTTLSTAERQVSPTHFHNSVHNAPAGYWSIATHSQAASCSLSAFDGTFAAGLIEAATLATCEKVDVLLVVYDVEVAAPLDVKRPISPSFSAAFILSAETADTNNRLHLRLAADGGETTLTDPGLEGLRVNNPAARALPLLTALARKESASMTVSVFDDLYVEMRLDA